MKDYLRTTLLLMGVSAPGAFAKDITIAAASDLTNALTEIKGNYENSTKNKVALSFGSTGNLFNQIQQGAPFDLFFAADVDFPRKLVALKLADESSLTPYAMGRLVLWVPKQSALPIETQGLKVLLDPAVQKIAIANPAHAPYGRAAEAALRQAGLYDQVKGRFVLGENISQTAQFVESGNAQVGLIALSLALSPNMRSQGRYWELPADSYPQLLQAVVLLTHAPAKAEAQAFLLYLKTSAPRAILQRYGFVLPEGGVGK